ncbi:MAG: hypothetical protein U0610_21635 [bacterium]
MARAAALGLVALGLGCGFTASKGNEPSGSENLPTSGVGPFLKQDFYCNTQLVQPFILTSPADAQRGGPTFVREPDGTFQIWSELRSGDGSRILRNQLTLLPGTQCRDFDVSVTADETALDAADAWEAGAVGAPTVLAQDGHYRMWFEGGRYAGIGYAESNDGLHWTRRSANPVLVPDQRWEAGTIGSPTVVFRDGLYRMWYDGNVNAARAIGYAESSDGVTWTKRDAFGRSSAGGHDDVVPVLTADQTTWEFFKPTDSAGSVGAPSVVVHHDPLRTYYLLYYTGNLRGRLDTRFDDVDSSIGIAFSENGLDWTKAPNKRECEEFECPANEINPNVAEKLPISLGPKVDGSFNSFSAFSIVDEAEPAVVEVPEELTFFLLWHQVDQINAKVAPSLPPDDSSLPPDGFTGATGIGFAFANNLPS